MKRIFSGRSRGLANRPGLDGPGLSASRRPLFRKRRYYFSRFLMGLLTVALVAWLAGLMAFIGAVPREPNVTARKADAIVVLTGGGNRLAEGMQLLAENRGARLLISGVHEGTTRTDLLNRFTNDPEAVECCVDLDRAALDTKGNAFETRRWVEAHGFTSLIVVTANYHMPRSLLEFRRAMPNVALIAHPVFPRGFSPTAEWDWAVAGRLLVFEYVKLLASYILPDR